MPGVIVKARNKGLIFSVILMYTDDGGVPIALPFLSVIQLGIGIKPFEPIEEGVNCTCILRFHSFAASLMNLNSYS
jgi:hypothetical protein